METESIIRVWLASCWLASILFVIAWTIYGVNMVTNQQVLQAATVIREFRATQNQFALFIQAISSENNKPIEIDSNVLAEMRNMWMLIEKESHKLGITPQEFMQRVSELLNNPDIERR